MFTIETDVSYLKLKELGWLAFNGYARESLQSYKDDETQRLVVLAYQGKTEKALILCTLEAAQQQASQLQNIENDLNSKFRFHSIEREIADPQTVESFLKDAANLSESVNAESDADTSNTRALSRARNLIANAIMQRASDIHLWIEPGGARAKFRIDGVMAAETTEFHEDEGREMVSSLLQKYAPGFSGYESDSRHIQEAIDLTIDVTYPTMVKSEKVRLRLDRTGSKDRKGYKATFRIQLTDKAAMNLEEAGYEPAMISTLKQMFDAPYGIFIATGKVNSGKSTTLFSMLEGISHAKSGISIEDPIEFKYTHPNITPIQVDNDDPKASLTAHLHSSLRKDPDFVNVAEIRTPEVAADVMGHARVGCVMSSTLHTNDAVTAFERLVEMGITAKELSNIDLFLGILSQRLMRKLCSHCCIAEDHEELEQSVHVRNESGCDMCEGGYIKGRTAVAELLIPDDEDSRFIRDENWQEWRVALLKKGFKTMAIRALELTRDKVICFDDATKNIPGFKKVKWHVEHYQK